MSRKFAWLALTGVMMSLACAVPEPASRPAAVTGPSTRPATAASFDDPSVPPAGATGNQWSIAVLPDPQAYNQCYDFHYKAGTSWKGRGYQYKDRFPKQIEWIVKNRQTYNIRFAAEVGDTVQSCGYDPSVAATQPDSKDAKVRGEWLNAVAAFNLFHKDGDPEKPALVPYAAAIGNHDYHAGGANADLTSTEYEKFLGPGRWKTARGQVKPAFAEWFLGDDLGWKYEIGGELKATGVGRNSYQAFTAEGRTFLHITLECAATDQAIAWAKTVLDGHPGVPTIITTHSFIDGGGTMLVAARMGRKAAGANPTNDAQQIFDKLIKNCDQIFMVLCGHCWLQKRVVLKNARGNSVHVLEQCYHLDSIGGRIDVSENPGNWAYKGESDGDRNGSGWLTLLMFDPDEKTITRFTYSPVLDVWATDRPKEYKGRTFPKGDDVIERFEFDFNARFGAVRSVKKSSPAEKKAD